MVPPRASVLSDAGTAPDAVEALAELRAARARHDRPSLSRVLGPKGMGAYRGYGEMLAAVETLVDRGARLAQVGRSALGEPLFALHLGADGETPSHTPGAARRSPTRRTSVVLSAVHPNEWIGVETCLGLLERLIARSDLGDRTVVAFPIVNPDGILRVEENLRRGRRRFVRHNAHGVDLNRNFDARWYERGLLQRLMPFLWASGPRPASEPEVQAIAHELAGRRIDRAVSLHSFGGAVLYPSAASVWPIPDADEHRVWAKKIAKGAAKRPYRALPCSWWAMGFTATGLELDWFHDRHGAVSMLVECSRGGVGLRPSRLLDPFAWFNPPNIDAVTLPLVDALLPFVRGDRA